MTEENSHWHITAFLLDCLRCPMQDADEAVGGSGAAKKLAQ